MCCCTMEFSLIEKLTGAIYSTREQTFSFIILTLLLVLKKHGFNSVIFGVTVLCLGLLA